VSLDRFCFLGVGRTLLTSQAKSTKKENPWWRKLTWLKKQGKPSSGSRNRSEVRRPIPTDKLFLS